MKITIELSEEATDKIKTYYIHTEDNTYMFTTSDEYEKLIVKGSEKSKNKTLYEDGGVLGFNHLLYLLGTGG